MDHLLGQLGLSTPKTTGSDDGEGRAPIELLSKFLIAVQDREMKEALVMARELLTYEPDNKMIKDYQKYIMEYIAQGLDEDVEGEEEEEEASEEEGDGNSDDEGNSDEDHSDQSSDNDDDRVKKVETVAASKGSKLSINDAKATSSGSVRYAANSRSGPGSLKSNTPTNANAGRVSSSTGTAPIVSRSGVSGSISKSR